MLVGRQRLPYVKNQAVGLNLDDLATNLRLIGQDYDDLLSRCGFRHIAPV